MDASLCAVHPDRAAVETCARCGSFMCDACRSEELATHCKECSARIGTGRFVPHVPALGIVMMAHGILVSGLGLYYLVFGGFFLHFLGETPPTPGADGDLFGPIMASAFTGIGLAQLVPGLLQMWAGWFVRTYRKRGLGIGALCAGIVASLGCYCAPTSIGILVWGLIVLLNADVAARFSATQRSAT